MILCKTGVRYLLPQQELVNCLLLPHALDYQPVQVDKQSSPKTTRNPTHTHTQRHGLFGLLKVKQNIIVVQNKSSHMEKELPQMKQSYSFAMPG